MRNWGGQEAVEDKEQVFYLAFSAMGKDLENTTTEAIKAYTVHCRNSSLWDLALKLELQEEIHVPSGRNGCWIN